MISSILTLWSGTPAAVRWRAETSAPARAIATAIPRRMAEAGLPDDFPIAWRTAPVRRRDPIVVHDAKTAFVQALFASLPRVQSENTNTTRLVSERTKRGPHRLFTNRYVDDRVLNHMCIPVLEFSMKLQRCSATEVDALAANLSKLARLYECGDHERLVELYEQLASLPGFVDVLRIGAGNELSRVLGGLVLYAIRSASRRRRAAFGSRVEYSRANRKPPTGCSTSNSIG